MGMVIKDNENKLLIIIHLNLPKDADNDLKHEVNFIIKHYKFAAEHTIKLEMIYLLSK